MSKKHAEPQRFSYGDCVDGLQSSGHVFIAGHDFGGPHLVHTGLMGDFGGLIYAAFTHGPRLHAAEQDRAFSNRVACLHRLLLDAASARGWRERRALEVLMQDDATEHDGVIRLLCGKAGRHLTPDDVQEAFRLSGCGGPLYIVSREFALKHHRRATRSARR